MRSVRNEKGIALVTALMFTLITLGIIMALLQFIIMGTKMSASQKAYRNSLEASYGGVELITKAIIPQLFTSYTSGKIALNASLGPSTTTDLTLYGSLQTKLATPTTAWPDAYKTITSPKDAPDMTFKLPGQSPGDSGYMIYAKIIDSVPGNTDTSGRELDSGIGVAGVGSGISPVHFPILLTFEVQGERVVNPKERGSLSVLYAY